MQKQKVKFREISVSALEDAWQRQATAAAIAGAREVIGELIPPATPIAKLSDSEWAYVIASVIFGWIQMRAQQASAEGHDMERTIRSTGIDPDPWDAGPVIAVLPELADVCADLDWSLPLATWPKETMAKFLLEAMRLIEPAMRARDLSDRGVTQKVTAKDLNDPIPS
jgi:hypothetical protein